MIKLELDGIVYTNFNEIEVSRTLDSLSGAFSLTAYAGEDKPFPVKQDAVCRVLVDGIPVVTGFVEIVEVSHSAREHTILLEGRDKTADVIDSTIGDGVDYNAPISLQAIITSILQNAGIEDIAVLSEVDDIKDFTEEDKISGEVGVSVFDLIEGYCRKRQVLLSSNGDGNIVLVRGSSGDSRGSLINKPGTPKRNNIKAGSISYNNTDRFNRYVVKSQTNTASTGLGGLSGLGAAKEVSSIEGESIDGEIRSSRTLVLIAEKSSDSEQCSKRAEWQANINRSRSMVYTATVQGHKNPETSLIWETNQEISVDDVYAGLLGKFLIDGVTFRQSIMDGSSTILRVVALDAYTLAPEAPEEQKESTGLFSL